ncbi:hypothetical protein LZD49_23080 [Dyadobacter sp. CY261]|uniref:hypothetical protein n=1 Tax=Dyadobacter sp. CY261 TaxID=2907203 RepID=UPI001F2C7D15|nr:hypothetical protein [Dyadobacter sp. CY261]MCF0073381.1 hypothetical protein [Dyadobacter sp. CY261]
MKKYVFVLFVALALACKSTGVDKKEEGIRYMQSVILNDVPKATLTFFEIEDSRCPEGVQCIWGGRAAVDLLFSGVTTEGGIKEHVKMCLGTCDASVGSDTLEKKFAGENYRLILTAVNPSPHIDSVRKKENYSILLKIEKTK